MMSFALVRSLKRQHASQAAGFAAIAIAAAAVIGWRAGLPLLSIWGSGYFAIGPFAVLMLAAFGLALLHPGKDSRFAFALGLAGVACATVGLVVVPFDIEFGIGRWLAPRAPLAGSFRVTSAGMLAFGLAAGALALARFNRHRLAATVLASIAGGITVFALLGYLSGVDTLYGSASVNSPSLPAAAGLLCVAVGIILRIGTMPVLHRSRPLWHLLLMLGCSIVAPLLLFGAYAGIRIADAQFDQVRDDLLSEARILSAGVDQEIVGEIERLQALAASPSLRQGDFAEFQRQAEASLRLRQSGHIVLIDRNMRQLVNTTVPFGEHLPKSALPEAVKRAMTTGRPQVTGLFMAPVAKQLLYAITVPVKIDGETRYVLGRSPDQHALAGLVAPNRLRTGWQAVVSDATHRVIARSDWPDGFVGRELSPSQWHRAGPEGAFEFGDTEGRPSLEAYTRSELTGWQTAVWAPKAVLEAPVRALSRTLVLIALLAIALVVALASWLGRIIARAVATAARAATDSGEGDPPWPSATPVTEVNTLMAELRETSQLLRGSERQLRLVTDNAPVGILHLDAELRYKFLNRYHAERLKAWLGLTPEQVIGKRLPELVGDRFFATLEPYARECLAGRAVEFEIELPLQAGEPQFLQCRLEPEWRDGRVVGLVSAGTNITRLKLAEAALGESEAAFRAMFDVSSVGKIEVDPESGRFLRANAAMCKFVGYTEEELLAGTVFDITHPDDRDHAYELLRRMIAGESAVSDLEKRCIRKDGKTVWARVTANVVRDESGRPLRNIAVILDISERKRAEEDLKASKDRVQIALDVAQLGSYRYDPRRRVFSGDARSQEIFDFPKAEATIEEFMKLVHPDDVNTVHANLETALNPVDPRRSATEFRIRRGDGEVRWVETLGLAYFEGTGHERRAVSFVGTLQDVTERKAREEKEHLLMREINHRAKNMLSVVDAIAHQTASRNPEDFVERFSERVQALSANQDLLVRRAWHGVKIEDLVRAQLAHFVDLIGSRIGVHGAKLCFTAASAQAIGLALHELATNAGKYGALSTDKGHVYVSWGTVDDTFTMSWTEHNGPPVSPPHRRGFGTIVMEQMAERSVNGRVDHEYAPSGVTWRLTCPAANALEPGEGENRSDGATAKVEVRTTI